MSEQWYSRSFRRNLVDMHIDDWNPEFLAQFDPKAYFECLKTAHIQTPMIYIHSHVGLCNWDSATGRVHRAFAGRNKVRELFDLCHGAGMSVVAYYSLIYNNWLMTPIRSGVCWTAVVWAPGKQARITDS